MQSGNGLAVDRRVRGEADIFICLKDIVGKWYVVACHHWTDSVNPIYVTH